MKKESIHIFSSIEKLANFFAGSLSENITETTGTRPFYIALSGGSTPREIFKSLVINHTNEIDWSKVMIFWGDERCVSPASDESNYRMAYESLIKKIDIPGKNIFRIEAEKDAAKEAERYSRLVNTILPGMANLPQFDLFLLGLGEDGHTASIFPGEIHLFHSEKLFEVSLHPATFQKRITATGRLINNSRQVCFLVAGENKAEKVAQILEKKPGWQDLPASLVKPTNGGITWMLDEAASQKLSERSGSFRDSDRFLSS
jgi:6-phosphogluconolactonase